MKGLPKDIIAKIAKCLDLYEDWLSFLCTCKQIYVSLKSRPSLNSLIFTTSQKEEGDLVKWKGIYTKGSLKSILRPFYYYDVISIIGNTDIRSYIQHKSYPLILDKNPYRFIVPSLYPVIREFFNHPKKLCTNTPEWYSKGISFEHFVRVNSKTGVWFSSQKIIDSMTKELLQVRHTIKHGLRLIEN